MASIVGIVNRGLIAIGADPITALGDGSNNANAAGAVYAQARDELLRAHPWNFAMARARPAKLAAAPEFGFAHAFQLPADWLRTVALTADPGGRHALRHKHEGRTVLADAETVHLRYVRRVEDPNVMDPLFRTALALKLAMEVADRVAHSETKVGRVAEQLERAVRLAKAVDGMEDHPDRLPAGSWTGVRG